MNLTLEDEWNDKNAMCLAFLKGMEDAQKQYGNPPINKTITELPIGGEVVIEDKNELE